MTDPLNHIISQAEKIIKENNNVYKFIKTSQALNSFAITATNTAGQNRSFLTNRNPRTRFEWETQFYALGWSNVIVSNSTLDGPLDFSAIPSATTTAGDLPYSQRAVSTTTRGLPLNLIPSLGRPVFTIPGLGGTEYTAANHTPVIPYGISETDNEIQLFFMNMSENDKFEIGWEGGPFNTWWDERAARASAPTGRSTSPGGSVASPEISNAFNQKIPSVNDAMYHEFLDLLEKKKQSAAGTGNVSDELPDERMIRQYESITGNPVANLYELGKRRTLEFSEFDTDLITAALRRLVNVLQLPQDYRTLRETDEASDRASRERAQRHLRIVNEIISPAASVAKGLQNQISGPNTMREFK